MGLETTPASPLIMSGDPLIAASIAKMMAAIAMHP
jgi:hypothetical protein